VTATGGNPASGQSCSAVQKRRLPEARGRQRGCGALHTHT
jgi:hypothetical protein